MALGRVKWFNVSKGFGFIEKQSGLVTSPSLSLVRAKPPEEIFVHYTSILGEGFKELFEGQEVEFDLYENEKGKIAQNVTLKG